MDFDGNGEMERIGGSPYEVGLALGLRGRETLREKLVPSGIWRSVTDRRWRGCVEEMMANTRARFPLIHEEIRGLADGLEMPFAEVAAWNCRGDIVANSADGCTTVAYPGEETVIGHNEDGMCVLRGSCFLAEIRTESGLAIRSFMYPGSIAGHTFGWNEAGLVITVNNIRLKGLRPQIPRMVLSRALLGCGSVVDGIRLLEDSPTSGGFHLTLCDAQDRKLVSVEFGGGNVVVRPVNGPFAHSNHALYLAPGIAGQEITRSSADRQARADALLDQGEKDPLVILGDSEGEGLPILRRDPDDPDGENTMATAVFRVTESGIQCTVWEPEARVDRTLA